MHRKYSGFTIVELLIVVVVIAILAAISVVAYTNMQDRAYDSRRESDIQLYQKALALARVDDGAFPLVTSGFAYIGSSGGNSAQFRAATVGKGYLPDLILDPVHNNGNDSSAYVYSNRNTTHSWFVGDEDPNTYAIRFRRSKAPTSGSPFFCATSRGIHQAGTKPGTSGNQCLEE